MKLEIRTRGIELTEKLEQHIERCSRFALTRFGDRVGRVRVQLADLNGPRGGVDVQCKIRAQLSAPGELVIEEVHHDPFAAVARATDRVSHSIARRLGRLAARRRGRLHVAGPVRAPRDR